MYPGRQRRREHHIVLQVQLARYPHHGRRRLEGDGTLLVEEGPVLVTYRGGADVFPQAIARFAQEDVDAVGRVEVVGQRRAGDATAHDEAVVQVSVVARDRRLHNTIVVITIQCSDYERTRRKMMEGPINVWLLITARK
jgi:hypothetical protein